MASIPNRRSPPITRRSHFWAAGRFRDAAKYLKLLESVALGLPWPTYVAGDRGECIDSAASEFAPELDEGKSPGLLHLGVLSRSQMDHWMRQAAVFLHMARYEPFGLAPLEAAAAGCALVLSNIESLREIWLDAALYVEPDDGEELIRVARWLALNEPWRKSLAERAQERARVFSVTKMAEAYLDCYFALLSGMSRSKRVRSVSSAFCGCGSTGTNDGDANGSKLEGYWELL